MVVAKPRKPRIGLLVVLSALVASTALADEIQVSSVLVKLIDQVEVPARESGVLDNVAIKEGEMVKAGALLAQIEDIDAQFEKRRAQVELAAARKQADSDVKIRAAKKALEVAEAELRRALDSSKRLAQSVSQSELDHLRLDVDQHALEVEQAQLEWDLSQKVRELKENELGSVEHGIQQRKIVAPLNGFVAQVNRHRGEWVQPGQTIVRILRLDQLRAEGLVSAQAVRGDLKGRAVKLTARLDDQTAIDFPGKVVFVSPEIDPVNGQVRIWAEIENTGLQLRPGLHGSMVIQGDAGQKRPE